MRLNGLLLVQKKVARYCSIISVLVLVSLHAQTVAKPDDNMVLLYADLTNLSEQFTIEAEKAKTPAQVMRAVDKYLKNSKPLYDRLTVILEKNKVIFKSSSDIVKAANQKWQNAVQNIISKESAFFPKYEQHKSLVKKWKIMRMGIDKLIKETEESLKAK